MNKDKGDPKEGGLRRRAEERLRGKKRGTELAVADQDATRLVHELHVHQIELELQNEELKHARGELEKQLEKYSDLYEFAPVSYFTLDMGGTIQEANLTGARLLGTERSRLVGWRLNSFMTDKSYHVFDLWLAEACGGTAGKTCEAALLTPGGRPRYVQIEGTPVEPGGGAVRQCRVAMIDITLRRQAEEVLRRYELLSRNSRDIVLFMLRDNGSILEANAAAETAYGYNREELLKLTINDLRADSTWGTTASQMTQADAGGILFETIHRRRDGSTFPVEVSSQGATIDGTRTLISVVRDITERRRAEEALQKSEQRYHSLFENMLDGFAYCKMLFDDQGRPLDFIYLDVNDAFGRLTGLKNVVGKKVTEAIPGIKEMHPQLFEIYGRVALTGQSERFEIEFSLLDAWLSVSVYSTEREHFVAVFDDITGRKRAEEALKEAKNELEQRVEERTEELQSAYVRLLSETKQRQQAEEQLLQVQKMEAIGTLAGGIAHDFNNMLAVIIGNAEMALEEIHNGTSESGYRVEQILKASMRAKDLVRQILTFSRKSEGQRKALKLSPLVKETAELLRGSLPSTINIELKINTDLDTILADPSQIQQILMNLASNAAHAISKDGGTLTIILSNIRFGGGDSTLERSLQPGRYVRLIVRDTGAGMRRDVQKRIFEPFFTTKEPGEGTGMGLAVVFGIVKSYEGAITVESKAGKGSAFNVFFPVSEEASEEEPRRRGSLPTGKESVLVVDDEPTVAKMVSETLERLGYQVTTAESGPEGWRKFENNPHGFNLVLTDHVMPDITGMRLAERMLEVRKDLPIILLTGYSETVSPEKAKAAGISEFLMKPVMKRKLAETVRRVLDGGE